MTNAAQQFTDDDWYNGGYSDGLSDAENAVKRAETIDKALLELKKLQGYVTCKTCKGTGERAEIRDSDLAKALLVSFGAQTDLSRPCETCWGEKLVKSQTA